MNENRRTNIPVRTIPQIVEWLLKNCSEEEIVFMRSLALNRREIELLNSIFTRLTDFNIHEVFYTKISNSEELAQFRSAKRGEVAGLKAFVMACQAAAEFHKEDEQKKVKKRRKG